MKRALLALLAWAPAALLAAAQSPTPVRSTCALPAPATVRSTVLTDLASAPVGAKVTVFGSGFGASGAVTLGGVPQAIDTYSDTCVVFIVSGSGGDLVVGGKPAGKFPIHAGRILETTPGRFRSTWSAARPGDIVYLHAGTYDSPTGESDWCTDCTLETFKQGTASQPIALVGYPGETAVLRQVSGSTHSVISLADQDYRHRRAAFLTFANFRIVGNHDCIYGGGKTSDPYGGPENSGATDIRVVNLTCEITDAHANTMTGMIALQGDRWHVLANTFIDPPDRTIINNNHGIYIQGGADDVEVAYNQLVGLHVGHVIQIHQDGKPFRYDRVWIHDNLLEGKASTDMRGINVANVDENSSVVIERNTLRNVGQDFSAIAIYRGNVTVRDNRFYAVRAPDISLNGQYGGTRHVVASGNRFETVHGYKAVAADNGASLDDIQLSGNQYCGMWLSQEKSSRPCEP